MNGNILKELGMSLFETPFYLTVGRQAIITFPLVVIFSSPAHSLVYFQTRSRFMSTVTESPTEESQSTEACVLIEREM